MNDRDRPDLRSGPAADFGTVLRKRARGEQILFDSAVEESIETWRPPERRRSPVDRLLFGRKIRRRPLRRSRRPSLVTATAVPALIAAVAGALVAPLFGGGGDRQIGPDAAAAADLAREAGEPGVLPQLVPVVDRGGRPELAAHRTGNGAASRPSIPTTISIPNAGIEAPIDAVGATAAGLALPKFSRAGWWEGGPRPGEDGRAVIVGHLDSKKGPDVFARVPSLAKNDRIVVRDSAGESHEYAVVGVTRVEKARFPKDAVSGPAARPVLVLVTCGGPYDPALGHYRDNVLVYARAV